MENKSILTNIITNSFNNKLKLVTHLLENATNSLNGLTYIDELGKKKFYSYSELYIKAQNISLMLRTKYNLKTGSKVFLQVYNISLFIETLWGCFLSGYVPVLVPLVKLNKDSKEKFDKILSLFEDKKIIFDNSMKTNLVNVDEQFKINIEETKLQNEKLTRTTNIKDLNLDTDPDSTALIIFTSGSTGIPKGVELSHNNLINSVFSKIDFLQLNQDDKSFNWMDLTHVAGVIECHLRDLACTCNQIHAYTNYIVSNPEKFLEIITNERITVSFTPNFFLGILGNLSLKSNNYDLSSLKYLVIGGELILDNTIKSLLNNLKDYNLHPNQLIPAFGMTETCAGSIYSKTGFQTKFNKLSESALQYHVCLGTPIHGVNIRIVNETNKIVNEAELGKLQIKGKSIFKKYYNIDCNLIDNEWFDTGDLGFISEEGIFLVGREKENIIINGLNYDSIEIESFLENNIEGLSKSYTTVISVISENKNTEELVIIFNAYDNELIKEKAKEIRNQISTNFGIVPSYLIYLSKEEIPKSNLGKIQRKTLKNQFIQGDFRDKLIDNQSLIIRKTPIVKPQNNIEKDLLQIICKVLSIEEEYISIDDNIFDFGLSSLQIILLIHEINTIFSVNHDATYVFQYPTIKSYSDVLALNDTAIQYSPLIQLNRSTSEPKLFCIPPFIGEGLGFLELSKNLNVPTYAFQGKGMLSIDDKCFSSIEEAAATYITAMKKIQAQGPYYLLGYSFGAFILYEMAKQLEKSNDAIAFFGNFDGNTFNHSKNIKFSCKHAFGLSVLVTTFDLISIGIQNPYDLDEVHAKQSEFCKFLSQFPVDEQYKYILDKTPASKVKGLGLDQNDKLQIYTKMSYTSFELASKYTFKDKINSDMNVFYAGKYLRGDLLEWQNMTNGSISFIPINSHHFNMFQFPAVLESADKVSWIIKH